MCNFCLASWLNLPTRFVGYEKIIEAIDLGLKGESVATVTACSSSTHSIGEAFKTIKLGYEDVILAGGTEASICGIGIAGFENMKALSSAEDKNRASIPFDKERSGFVMGEGAGMILFLIFVQMICKNLC